MTAMRFRSFRKFSHARDGAVAVEFALVAIPFFMMVMGLLEISLMYAAGAVLEGGTVAAARMIRTGQAQQSADAEVSFRDALCAHVDSFIPCGSLLYEVIHPPGDTFDDADGIPAEYDDDGNLIPQGFDPGGVSDVVVIRTSYRYKFITPFIGPLLSGASDFSIRLQSTVTVRNEPYEFED